MGACVPPLRQAAPQSRLCRTLGLAKVELAPRHVGAAWQVARRGRPISCRIAVGRHGRVGAVMRVASPCAARLRGSAANIASEPRPSSPRASAAASPPMRATPLRPFPLGMAGYRTPLRDVPLWLSRRLPLAEEKLARPSLACVKFLTKAKVRRASEMDVVAPKAKPFQVRRKPTRHRAAQVARLRVAGRPPAYIFLISRTYIAVPIVIAGLGVAVLRGEFRPLDTSSEMAIGAEQTVEWP